jgi:hypothetical protein
VFGLETADCDNPFYGGDAFCQLKPQLLAKAATQTTYVLSTSNGSTLKVGYDSTNSQIVYEASVKVGTYLAIGFGTSMTDIDMISWDADTTAATSVCQKLWSTGHTHPTVTTDQTFLTTSAITLSSGFINFNTVRPLAGTNSETFNVALDSNVPMVWAFGSFTGNKDSTSDDGMQYHNGNRDWWNLTIKSDGTVVSGGTNGLVSGPYDLLKMSNGSTLSVGYDKL